MAKILELLGVNVAVRSLASATPRLEGLGLVGQSPVVAPEPPQQITDVSFPLPGGGAISLIEPTDSTSPTAAFLESRGEGVHSVAVRVDDLRDAMMTWTEASGVGWGVSDPVVVTDAHVVRYHVQRALVNWVRPSTFNGVVLEVFEFQGKVRTLA